MKKEVGASAGLLALLALFLHTQLPSSDKTASGDRNNAATAAKKDSDKAERIEDVDGPWLATRAFSIALAIPFGPKEIVLPKSASRTLKI